MVSVPATECDPLAQAAADAQTEVDSITQLIEQMMRDNQDTKDLDREYEQASARLSDAVSAYEECQATHPPTSVTAAPPTDLLVEIVSRISDDARLEVWVDGQMKHQLQVAQNGRNSAFVWESLSRVHLVFARRALFGVWTRYFEISDMTAAKPGEHLTFTWESEG